jgi:hypothetical protein
MCMRPKAGQPMGICCVKLWGKSHSVQGNSGKKSRKQLCTVCTQFIQGNVPMDPDRLCAWDEKIGIFGGRLELSTWLSPAVDNSINRCKIRGLRSIPCATIRCILSPITL